MYMEIDSPRCKTIWAVIGEAGLQGFLLESFQEVRSHSVKKDKVHVGVGPRLDYHLTDWGLSPI